MSSTGPRTIVEFVDYEQVAKDPRPLPHKTARIFVNGSEVRLARDGARVYIDHEGTTRVTLGLLPDEVRFAASPAEGKPTEPEPVVIQGAWTLRERARRRPLAALDLGKITSRSMEFKVTDEGAEVVRQLFFGGAVAPMNPSIFPINPT